MPWPAVHKAGKRKNGTTGHAHCLTVVLLRKNERFFATLRGCDFFDFSQKATLKTTGLDAKKSSYRNKVTSSQNDKFKAKAKAKAKSNAAAGGSQGGKKEKT